MQESYLKIKTAKMRLLVTTNARLYKAPSGLYYTSLVYSYDFFLRYLDVFDEIRLVAHVEPCDELSSNSMLLVSGPHLEVYEMPFPHGKVAYIKNYLRIQRKVKDCMIGCDAALFRVPDQLAFQIFDKAKRVMPVAIEVTSDPLELYSSKGGKYPLRLFIKWTHYYSLRRCCRKADCVSYVTNEYLQKVYPSNIKRGSGRFETHYTSAGIDRHAVPSREYPIKAPVKLLHVSASIVGRNKGHKELIEAFLALRAAGYDLNLILTGSGMLDSDIWKQLEKSGESSRVFFTGLLDRIQLSEMYKNADIFVFPSYREGLPRVVIEAMSWGLPCITTDIPGCKELLNERMLVGVGDTSSLIDKVKAVLDNAQLQNEESERNIRESGKYLSDTIRSTRNVFYGHLKELVKL